MNIPQQKEVQPQEVQYTDKENFDYNQGSKNTSQVENYIGANISVENRLDLINKAYKQRKIEKSTQEKVQTLSNPKINQNSKKLLKEKYGNHPQKRVDQRLYEDHKKRQIAQNVRQKLVDQQQTELANPKLSQYQPQQVLSTGDGKEIVNRLMDYKLRYTEHEKNLKRKYDDKECTFKPEINQNSRRVANELSYGMPLEFRNTIDVNKYHNRSKNLKTDRNCTFKPQVCPKSKAMAETKQYYENQPSNVFHRLGGTQRDSSESENFEPNLYQPQINPISEEIDYNIHCDDQKPRWERVSQKVKFYSFINSTKNETKTSSKNRWKSSRRSPLRRKNARSSPKFYQKASKEGQIPPLEKIVLAQSSSLRPKTVNFS